MTIDGDDLIIIGFVCIVFILILATISCFVTEDEITINDTIIAIDNGHDYMTITFKNSGTYNVNYPSSSDPTIVFTSGDKVNIKLYYFDLLWVTNTNNCWGIEHYFIVERGK